MTSVERCFGAPMWANLITKDMNITINSLEVASELAHGRMLTEWDNSKPMYDGENYTDEAQDIFNDLYDYYLTIIEELQIN